MSSIPHEHDNDGHTHDNSHLLSHSHPHHHVSSEPKQSSKCKSTCCSETKTCDDTSPPPACCSVEETRNESESCHRVDTGCHSKSNNDTIPLYSTGCSKDTTMNSSITSCHNKQYNSLPKEEEAILCLAVLRENGNTVDVFDAEGAAKTFSAKHNSSSHPKLCFSTHGHDADSLLSPCFDDHGKHGDPEESCFCGIDEPHLHAHVHNPENCNNNNVSNVMTLAQLTLLPTHNDVNGGVKMPVNESLPKECNSKVVRKRLHSCGMEEGGSPKARSNKVSYMVQHEDHVDHLVHNCCTGKLHLEHSCNSCGDTDLHGQLDLVGKRSWNNPNEPNIHFQFYEVPEKPFTVLDHIADRFCLNSSRVAAVRPLDSSSHNDRHFDFEETSYTAVSPSCMADNAGDCKHHHHMVRSEFEMKQVDLLDLNNIDAIIKPLRGVQDLQIATRETTSLIVVEVEHDPSFSSADDIAAFIRELNVDVTILLSSEQPQPSSLPNSTSGRSSLFVSKICCASEIPAINKIVQPLPGVSKVMVNTLTKTVYVDHDFTVTSAPDIEKALNAQKFGAKLQKDAGAKFVSAPFSSNTFTKFGIQPVLVGKPFLNTSITTLKGVSSVNVHSNLCVLLVDHDPAATSAYDIQKVINSDSPTADVLIRDVFPKDNPTADCRGRSVFFVEKICCASEIPAIRTIVEPLSGVHSVSISVTTKTVYVEHDIMVISGEDIVIALNAEKFGAHVKKDASKALVQQQRALGQSKFVETTLMVEQLGHELDVQTIDTALSSLSKSQVSSFATNSTWGTIKVDHNPKLVSAPQIKKLLEEHNFSINIVSDGEVDGNWTMPLLENGGGDGIEKHVAKVSPFVILSGVFWLISMLSLIGGEWEHVRYVALLSVLVGLPPIFMKAVRTLRRYQFDANCMMLFAALGAVALQEFTEAAAVAFLFSISEWLETRATSRARNALSAIVNLRPDRANLINPHTRNCVMVPAESVAVGAMVSVRTGDKIPCDGIVVEGSSIVDESSLTGESFPVRKTIDDTVSGGTINVGNTQLVVKTTATVDNSAVARLIRLVEEAQANRSPTETMIDELAKRYTPLVILAAICMCTIPWIYSYELGLLWTKNGLITIVIACPCALIISTPVTYVAGLAACAQRGIVVKGGAHLEALAQIKKVAFDKTGTLTKGRFSVLHLNKLSERLTRTEMLEYLSVAEAPATHPIAATLVEAVRNEGVCVRESIVTENHTMLEGEGVVVSVNGKKIHVGNKRLFNRLGLLSGIPVEAMNEVENWASTLGTIGFISVEEIGIVGMYCVADAVRQESANALIELKKLDIDVVMLTGDARKSALVIGNQIGLSPHNIKSELLPKEKLDVIAEMKKNDRRGSSLNPCKNRQLVLMCGDGVNDAPALACADVGVAMGAGAALSMETSDITLMDSNLNKLLYSLKMGRKVKRTILENIIFSFVAKAVVMIFTLNGMASLWAAIVSDVGAMLIVTINGMKLLPSRKEKMDFTNNTGYADKDHDIICVKNDGRDNQCCNDVEVTGAHSHTHNLSNGGSDPISGSSCKNAHGEEHCGSLSKVVHSIGSPTVCKDSCCSHNEESTSQPDASKCGIDIHDCTDQIQHHHEHPHATEKNHSNHDEGSNPVPSSHLNKEQYIEEGDALSLSFINKCCGGGACTSD